MDDGLFYTETMRLGSLDKIFIVNRRITKCTYIVLITSDLWEIENPSIFYWLGLSYLGTEKVGKIHSLWAATQTSDYRGVFV